MTGTRKSNATIHWLQDVEALTGTPADLVSGRPLRNVELDLFRLGLKPAVKVEDQRPEEVDDLRDLARQLGAGLEVVERTTGPTTDQRDMAADADRRYQVFLAHEATQLPLLVEMERRERRGGQQRRKAIARSGDLLGYPPCCVRAFLGLERQDDELVLETYRGQGLAQRTAPLFNVFPPQISPITWYPCSLTCEATRRFGEVALERLAKERGHSVEPWLAGTALIFRRFLFVQLLDLVEEGGWLHYKAVADALSFSDDPLFAGSEALVAFRLELTSVLAAGSALQLHGTTLRVRVGTTVVEGRLWFQPLRVDFA